MAEDSISWRVVFSNYIVGFFMMFWPLVILGILFVIGKPGIVYSFFVNLSFPSGILAGIIMSAWVWHFMKNKDERLRDRNERHAMRYLKR